MEKIEMLEGILNSYPYPIVLTTLLDLWIKMHNTIIMKKEDTKT